MFMRMNDIGAGHLPPTGIAADATATGKTARN